MTDHKKAIPWVLAAIAKVKGQKQQPNEERICQVLLQSYAMEKTEGLEHLQKCVEEGIITCTLAKNGKNSYRNAKSGTPKCKYFVLLIHLLHIHSSILCFLEKKAWEREFCFRRNKVRRCLKCRAWKSMVHINIVHHICTKDPFKEHKTLCTKIRYTASKTSEI